MIYDAYVKPMFAIDISIAVLYYQSTNTIL